MTGAKRDYEKNLIFPFTLELTDRWVKRQDFPITKHRGRSSDVCYLSVVL